jgi:hypothetical protein
MPVETVLRELGTRLDGLPAAEADRCRRTVAADGRPSLLRVTGAELVNPFTPVLVASAVGSVVDTALVTGESLSVIKAATPAFAREVAERRSMLYESTSIAAGIAAVQRARYFEADVTGVRDTMNLDLVRSLGAVEVIDHTREDFTQSGQTYDVISTRGGKHVFRAARAQAGRLLPGHRWAA